MKLNLKVALFITTGLLLASCNQKIAFLKYERTFNDDDTYTRIDFSTYYKPAYFVKDYIDVLKSGTNPKTKVVPLRSSGEQKLLVLPVAFPDYSLNKLDGKNGEIAHIHLQNAFFGKNSTTSWRSVSGFYEEASYGKLSISGEVAPWFTLPPEYATDLVRARVRSSSDKINETARIANAALVNFEKVHGGKLSDYDTDNDGIIDGIYVIYAHPYETKATNNIFWAFASNMNRIESQLTRQANAYSWSSYYYTNIKDLRKPDAHTFIHEVGHILGLSDYYNTNYDDPYSPLGGFDMMDYTLGDHGGLSKMLLNWTRPYIVTGSGNIKLRPFNQSGDLLLLKKNWNERANDEYLLLEYYSPEKLNALDSSLNAPFKLPKTKGIKVYHVDARTAYEVKVGLVNNYYYTNTYNDEEVWPEVVAHSNSSGGHNSAPFKQHKLIKLLEPKEGTNISGSHKLANSTSLFKKGDDFGVNYFKDFVFNDGTPFGYKVFIENINSEFATINVEVL